MKTYKNLFDKVINLDNFIQAAEAASSGKKRRAKYLEFKTDLATNLDALIEELKNGTYQVTPYNKFTVTDRLKPRVIYAPAFRDVVVQQAIYRVIGPIFDRKFIDQTYACRYRKGTHKASEYAQKALRASSTDNYTLKMDIRKFFYSIDRGILRKQISNVIKDRRLLDLLFQFTDFEDSEKGIPIGNLLSQLFAQIYMNGLDHYIKRVLKVKLYCRYVDDFILFDLTKQRAIDCRKLIEEYAMGQLGLRMSKVSIGKIKHGVNFVGYRTWASHRLVRKYIMKSFREAIKVGNQPAIQSYLGHAQDTASLDSLVRALHKSQSAQP